ncbi:hypothetical protein Tco_1309620, partial [Tanacetum coccineum]
MDLKWQVAMISMRMKKFYKKTGRRLKFDANEPVGFDKTKNRRRDAGNTGYKAKDSGRRPGKQEETKALITLDGEGIDWTGHAEDEQENFALMAYSNSGSYTEREQLGDASIEIKAYTQALKKAEAQLVAHQQSQLWYEEKIRFMKIDLDDKTDISVKDKIGLGFKEQVKENELYDEASMSVFDSHSSDIEDALVSDRFAKNKGMHAVPPPMTGNYMPPGPDIEIDESQFTYGAKQSKISESDARSSDFNSCESNSSIETLESVPESIVNKPKVVSQPKVWYDAPI